MSVCAWPLLWKCLSWFAELQVRKGSCIFFHDFRMVQLSLANELPPVRAKLACTASAQFYGNIICSFSWSKIRNVFCAGKNWNYICQNGTRFNEILDVSEFKKFEFVLNFSLVQYFCLYVNCLFICWIYWTIEQGAILAQAVSLDQILPSRPRLFVCCVVYYLLVRLL